MAQMSPQQYEESLRRLKLKVYLFGRPVTDPVDDLIIRPSMRAVAKTYEMACQPDCQDVMTAVSHLTGKRINRFTHIHQSTEDLIQKSKMGRLLGRETGCCFQRCVGMDALNALSIVTFAVDRKYGTVYHQRFRSYLQYVQEQDLVCDGAMTDPKGDRSLLPHRQPDPDMYLRVVAEKSGGIVVRGAKAHQTGAVNSHEIIVMPTLTMRPGEEDWAICFTIPTNAEGIRYIYGRQASDTRKMEDDLLDVGNPTFGGQEVMTVFDHVFVPEERIFLNGEVDFSGQLVERFAAYHRQSYGGCKTGVGDVLIGATALIARMNGVARAGHINEKIVDMIHLNETLWACGLACSHQGRPTPSGNYLVDLLLANVCKLNVTRFPYEIARLATDVAGGLLGTLPSAHDLADPEAGPYIKKYLASAEGVGVVDRIKVLRLIENLIAGAGAVGYLIESMHGAGPPAAQRIMIGRQGDLDGKIELVKSILGI